MAAWKPDTRTQCAIRALDTEQRARERLLERQLRGCFSAQYRTVMAALTGETKAAGDRWLDEMVNRIGGKTGMERDAIIELLQRELGDRIDWDTGRMALERILIPAWKTGFDAGAKTAEQVHGIPAIRQPMMTQALINRGLERLDAIETTTRKEIARSLADGVQVGERPKQLARRVQERLPGVQAGRAQVIAMTEVHTSIQAGNMAQLEAAGYATKIWSAIMDDDTRDAHREIHGQERPIKERFGNGLMYPGDPSGPPAQIINCRCVLMPGKTMRQARRENERQDPRPAAMEPVNFVNKNLASDDYTLWKNAQNVKPIAGYEDVFIHGSPTEFIVNATFGEQFSITPEELAERLRASANYKGGSIRLISCAAGKLTAPESAEFSAAQRLADALGVEVMASTTRALIYPDGELLLEDIDEMTNLKTAGKWVIFKSRR